jgi:hypothetical protein
MLVLIRTLILHFSLVLVCQAEVLLLTEGDERPSKNKSVMYIKAKPKALMEEEIPFEIDTKKHRQKQGRQVHAFKHSPLVHISKNEALNNYKKIKNEGGVYEDPFEEDLVIDIFPFPGAENGIDSQGSLGEDPFSQGLPRSKAYDESKPFGFPDEKALKGEDSAFEEVKFILNPKREGKHSS